MKVNELRIGNWVLINNKYIHVDVKIFHAIIHEFEGYIPLPIPLTPEILEKFGFESNKYVPFELNGIEINSFGEGYFFEWKNKEGKPKKVTSFKYLHELQNLYFALTGEELVINL